MKILLPLLAFAGLLGAWNHVGHKAIAGLAYDLLTDRARARADELIRRHPDFALMSEGAPAEEKARIRYAFMAAAYWPDTIRGDLRFYDDTRRDSIPTETRHGFPDMKRHTDWHYINVPFSTDGTATVPPRSPNVRTEVSRIIPLMGGAANPGSHTDPVFLLPWLLHLVGDIHQPLHCASRFRKGQNNPETGRPWSDLGGNTINVVGAYNLHAYWDDLLGITGSHVFVNGVATALAKRTPPGADNLDPEQWVAEGWKAAQDHVYSFGNEGGSKEAPIQLTDAYRLNAQQAAMDRAAVGARRLAAILNRELR
ncbi:MAG: S1/P1 nuclease [Acidobacteria bacterium]|nr:S1/P1 nuclease [Acidobacteriota bacterium]